jgi:hypothetical protein
MTFMQSIDHNGDGKMSFGEFVAWYRLGKDSGILNYVKHLLAAQHKFKVRLEAEAKTETYLGESKFYFEITDRRNPDETQDQNSTVMTIDLRTGHELISKNHLNDIWPNYVSKREKGSFIIYLTAKSSNPTKLCEVYEKFILAMVEFWSEDYPKHQNALMALYSNLDTQYFLLQLKSLGSPVKMWLSHGIYQKSGTAHLPSSSF